MASKTLHVGFPVGTTVDVYTDRGYPVVGTPPGSKVASTTVQSDGTVTYSTLADGTYYLAYASVGGRDFYEHFATPFPDPEDSVASIVTGQKTFTKLPVVGAGDLVNPVTVDPGGASNVFQAVTLNGFGRIFHLTTGASVPSDYSQSALIGMGVDYGGTGLLVSVKGLGSGGRGIGVNSESTSVLGNFGFLGTQKSTGGRLMQLENDSSVPGHAPLLILNGQEATAGQHALRVQTTVGGVGATRGYIDSRTGEIVWSAKVWANAAFSSTGRADFKSGVVGEHALAVTAIAGQVENPMAMYDSTPTKKWWINASGNMLGQRAALIGTNTGLATYAITGESGAFPVQRNIANGTNPGSLLELAASDGTTVLSRFNKAGYFMTAKASAPADADLNNNELAIWSDDSNVNFKKKTSTGTIKTATVALA